MDPVTPARSLVGRRLLLRSIAVVTAMAGGLFSAASWSYERDVHFGLTRWLAMKAGFSASEADAIATGNSRLDSETMETSELPLAFGCFARDKESEAHYRAMHFPADDTQGAVVAGAPGTQRQIAELVKGPAGKEGAMLSRFGALLHPIQDSFSYAGTPVSLFDIPLPCLQGVSVAPPLLRGGGIGHQADLTFNDVTTVVAMAKATYERLKNYPVVDRRQRKSAEWRELEERLLPFARARTKTEKRAWFATEGFAETDFLQGISLPDGTDSGRLEWKSEKLPTYPVSGSRQWELPEDLKAPVVRFFEAWMTGKSVSEWTSPVRTSEKSVRGDDSRLLDVKLKLWRVRDHGAVAGLLHPRSPLGAKDLGLAKSAASRAAGLVTYEHANEGFLPIQQRLDQATPILPYIIYPVGAVGDPLRRATAIARLRHAPYDNLAFSFQSSDGTVWRLTDVQAVVAH